MKRIVRGYYGLVQVLLVLGFAFSSLGCSKGDDSSSKTNTASKGMRNNPHNCEQTSEKCYKETFDQPTTETRKVDVLFVVQTSQDISPERQAIVAGINNFIASLPAGSDFNIGVMLAHGSTSTWSGRLYRAETEPIVLKSSELSNAQIQNYLSAKLNQVPQDLDAGGGEEGMFSLFNGITNATLLSESQTQGFFRSDAALGVVFVADRRDICAVVPAGVPAETDSGKIDARIRDCEGLTAQGLTNRLDLLKGAMPLAVSGIIYIDEPVPAGNEVGYGITDMITLNQGVAVDIANDDIAEGLESIAELSGQQMVIQKEFTLEHGNIDPSTVKVTVNGQAATFTLNGQVVTITSDIPAGAVVVIEYCVKQSNGGGQDPHPHKGCRHKHWDWHWCWDHKKRNWTKKWCYKKYNKWDKCKDDDKHGNSGKKHGSKW